MSFVSVDVEATLGGGPGCGSVMTEFGAVIVREPLVDAFHGIIDDSHLIPPDNDLETMIVAGSLRGVLLRFEEWLSDKCIDGKIFISDNNGFDWGFINHGFLAQLDRNPFGHSSQNLGSLYKGLVQNMAKNFKHLRDTRHTHNPVDDALGNAQALIKMAKMGLKIKLV